MRLLMEQAQAQTDATMNQFSATLINAADIKPCGIDWIRDQWLLAGKLAILAGLYNINHSNRERDHGMGDADQ